MLKRPHRIPRATYRFQLNGAFPFDNARELVPYLAELGISELYASPIFRASPGSSHGYDVNDPNLVNPELGGREALDALSATLKENGLGLLLDFVPNHMGITGPFNHWWLDVLGNGRGSRYAHYFDIQWNPLLESLADKVLVPMLTDFYGTVLEQGRLQLRYLEGSFWVLTGGARFPIRPGTYSIILDRVAESLPEKGRPRARLERIARSFDDLPVDPAGRMPCSPEERDEQIRACKTELTRLLEKHPAAREALDAEMVRLNGNVGDPRSFDDLHELLERQHYRLTFWKAGAHEVNYRRFFAIDTLVGLRMEEPGVFRETHLLLAELIAAGVATGVRIDHIDGLWNPADYLRRLAAMAREAAPEAFPPYTLVEKIVEPGEDVNTEWAVHGTSGYEFAASLIALFMDGGLEGEWSRIYARFTGIAEPSMELAYQDKKFILREIFPNTVASLTVELDRIVELDRRWRDLTRHDLGVALAELIACLPVYRTYRAPGEKMRPEEARFVHEALELAIKRNGIMDPGPLRFMADVITGEYPPEDAPPALKKELDRWVGKLQQATGAAMAKSIEDTHFYRYVRMFGANEVGNHPANFGAPLEHFHAANARRQERWPFNLLTTSTHDTKVSEDTRARLFALSEMPGEWEAALETWRKANTVFKLTLDGRAAPDANEEYLLYQVLLGAWPLDPAEVNEGFEARIRDYLRKAVAEAKVNTNWIHANETWLEACDRFVHGLLEPSESEGRFLQSFRPLAERVAAAGMVFSLGQVLLKLTCPGVPDIYQGNEVWDFSLVDPDNRRWVDYAKRRELLAGLDARKPAELLKNWRDGGIKLFLTRALLKFRARHADLFADGAYEPVTASGPRENALVAFQRVLPRERLLVVATRSLRGFEAGEIPPVGKAWAETALEVEPGPWTDVLTGRQVDSAESVAEVLKELPVAALYSGERAL
jgi:(1->4)-alpha-D-glucan 1-alpha-D-glucosylmutase